MSVQRTVQITNRRGLHARASAKFVTLASALPCEVHVCKDDGSVTGTSIMGLMMLGAAMGDTITTSVAGAGSVTGTSIMGLMMLGAAMGDEITISASGDGADDAVGALCELVEAKFGED